MIFKKYFSALIFLLIHSMFLFSSQAEKTIKVGVYDNYPKVILTEAGEIKGIFPEILEIIAHKQNWKLDFVTGSWSEGLQRLKNGEIDIMVDVALSEKRRKIYDFNNISVLLSWGRIYTTPDEEINSIIALEGKTIAVMKNSILTNGEDGIYSLIKKYEVDCEFQEVKDYYQVFELLDKKKVDAGIVNRQFGAAFEDKYIVKKSDFLFYPTPLRYAFSKDADHNDYLIEKIDDNLDKMKKNMNSEYYQILTNYNLYPKKKLPPLIIPMILGLFGLIIILLILYKGLKWQIKKQTQMLKTTNLELRKEIENHRQTYKKLKQSRENYRNFVENIPGIVFMYDQDESGNRTPIIHSQRYKTFFGEKIAEEIKKDYNKFFEYIVPEDRKRLQQFSNDISNYIKNLDIEYRIRIAEDKINWFRSIGKVKKLANGKYRWQGVLLDVEAKKKAEEALELAAFQWQTTFDSSHDVIFLLDKDQKVLQANKASKEIFGFDSEEDSKKYCYEIIHNSHEPIPDCPFTRMKKSGKRETKELELENGVWLLITIDPILDENENLVGAVHNVREITERKKAEQKLHLYRTDLEKLVRQRTKDLEQKTSELEKANRELLEADKLKSIFLASMSHELRTPLNSIIGFTGILLMGMVGDLSEEQRKQLEIVKKSANHLLELINDLLDISKIESGRVQLSQEFFSINDLIQNVIESLQHTAAEKGIKIKQDLPQKIEQYSDQRRTKQIIINLLSNAVKFTEEGYISITAKKVDGHKLEIIFEDTGIGIETKDLNKLFEPFQQIDSSLTKKYDGSGLGLHLTKKIVELFKGSIEVKSKPGIGTKFKVLLPLYEGK